MNPEMQTPKVNIADIENALAVQGHFCLLEWLLRENYLAYNDYESWRYGKVKTLDKYIPLRAKVLGELANDISLICDKLELSAQKNDYFLWGQEQRQHQALLSSSDKALHEKLSAQWLRAQDLPQMDLFMDNSAVVAENGVLDALAARQFNEAQEQLNRLTELNPKHERLGSYQDLINYGYHMSESEVEQSAVEEELAALEQEVTPLANEVMKHCARDYLALAWRRLNNTVSSLAFDERQPIIHSSYMLAQIPDWSGALTSIEKERERYSSPTLLLRSALCMEALKRHNETLLLWCLLAEKDGAFAEDAIEKKVSPTLWNLWQDFWELNDAGESRFFSAFIFAKTPGLVHHLKTFPDFTHPNTLAIIAVIHAKLNGKGEIAARKELQNISPALLRLFMSVGG